MAKAKLYHFPGTRSNRARWAIHEVGLEVEEVNVDLFKGEQQQEDYQKVNPLGVVPTLIWGEAVIGESAAIVAFLADQHPAKGLAPSIDSVERGQYYHWLIFGPAELDHYLVTISHNTLLLPPDARDPQAVVSAQENFDKRAEVISATLEKQPYLLGDTFSAADISVGHSIAWAKMIQALDRHPKLRDYLARLEERPAFQAVWGPKVEIFSDPHAQR